MICIPSRPDFCPLKSIRLVLNMQVVILSIIGKISPEPGGKLRMESVAIVHCFRELCEQADNGIAQQG